MYEDREEELRTSEENTTTFLSVAHPANQVINKLFKRFSLRFQLKKCVAWMLWFKDCWRNAVAKRKRGEVIQPCSEKKLSPLDVKEMKAAEKAIIRAVQGLGFYEELLSLRTVQREVKKSSSIVKLDPVFVEGIICVGGRLHNSPIKKKAKHPVIYSLKITTFQNPSCTTTIWSVVTLVSSTLHPWSDRSTGSSKYEFPFAIS